MRDSDDRVAMSTNATGGDGVPRALLLAFVAILCGTTPGCRRQMAPRLPAHSVRISALLQIHPSWPAWEAIQKRIAIEQSTAGAVHVVSVNDDETIAPPAILPENRVAEHEKLVQDDASRYLNQLDKSLEMKTRESVASRRRVEEQTEAVQYANSLDKKITELRDQSVVQARGLQKDLSKLNYRTEALASQSRVYASPSVNARHLLEDVRLQQVELDRQVQLKNAEIDGILKADFAGLARESLKPFQLQLRQEREARMVSYKAQLLSADAKEVALARTRVSSQPAPIPPLADHASEIEDPGATPVSLVLPAPDPSVLQNTRDVAKYGRDERVRLLTEQADKIRAVVLQDVTKAVEEIAHREHWLLLPEGTADDWTAHVREQLRSTWKAPTVR